MDGLVVKPILERGRVLRAVTLDVCDAAQGGLELPAHIPTLPINVQAGTNRSPFALPVDLMLGECDVFVVDVDAQAEPDLPEILISRPL